MVDLVRCPRCQSFHVTPVRIGSDEMECVGCGYAWEDRPTSYADLRAIGLSPMAALVTARPIAVIGGLLVVATLFFHVLFSVLGVK